MVLYAHIRLADRKGFLVGDLNVLQQEALEWLIMDEITQKVDLERERMKYTILAGNLYLWQELYGDQQTDEVPDKDVEWFVPTTTEEVEDVIAYLNALHEGGHTSSDG